MEVLSLIRNEINSYLNDEVYITEGFLHSQHKLIKRITIYANQIYAEGKLDDQDKYKYWYDIISPRIDDEVKNIDFDTKHIELYVDPPSQRYEAALKVANSQVVNYLRKTGQAKEINDALEEFSGWGNVIWKKVKKGYERMDLKNTYVINTMAENLNESPVIERHIYTQSKLRAMDGIWDNVNDVIKECGKKQFIPVEDEAKTYASKTEIPYYEIFERNGEITEHALFEAQKQKKEGGSKDKYVLAKVICAGLKSNGGYDETKILWADKISEMPYEEAHRGRFAGRWFRKGIIELLFDPQTRINEIGNQISRGLEWSSKTIFFSGDNLIVENITTDMDSGDILKAKDIKQLETRMQGFDQLAAEWNRIIALSKDITKSYEIVQGETLPGGTPFRLGALMNVNANKFFEYMREKIGIAFERVLENWVVPGLLSDIKTKDIIEIAGDSDFFGQFCEALAKNWYIKNLLAIGPHDEQMRDLLIANKVEELKKRPRLLLRNIKEMYDGLKPKVKVVITGENVRMGEDLETYKNFAALEQDPVRRQALIEQAMRIKGINVSGLPKSRPEALTPMGSQVKPQVSLEAPAGAGMMA